MTQLKYRHLQQNSPLVYLKTNTHALLIAYIQSRPEHW